MRDRETETKRERGERLRERKKQTNGHTYKQLQSQMKRFKRQNTVKDDTLACKPEETEGERYRQGEKKETQKRGRRK